MVLRRFYGKQRDERLWERNLYICEEANRQVPPIVVGLAFLMVCMLGGICIVQSSLRCSIHSCNSAVMYLLCLLS